MKTWFEWSLGRHINVAWRWALVAMVVFIAPTQISMLLKGILLQVSWIPEKLPQTLFMNTVALYLIVLLSYLTVIAVSKQTEEKARKGFRDCLRNGLIAGIILSCLALLVASEPQNRSWLVNALAILGLPFSIGLGSTLGFAVPKRKLEEDEIQYLAFFLGCGLTSILLLGIGLGPVPLLVIGLGLILIAAISFGLTELVRFFNRKSLWTHIGNWLIAAE
jgi:hypothetical protein